MKKCKTCKTKNSSTWYGEKRWYGWVYWCGECYFAKCNADWASAGIDHKVTYNEK